MALKVRKKKILRINKDKLLDIIKATNRHGLPDDAKCTCAYFDWVNFLIVIESAEFADIPTKDNLPEIRDL